jgi:hypothetical protein
MLNRTYGGSTPSSTILPVYPMAGQRRPGTMPVTTENSLCIFDFPNDLDLASVSPPSPTSSAQGETIRESQGAEPTNADSHIVPLSHSNSNQQPLLEDRMVTLLHSDNTFSTQGETCMEVQVLEPGYLGSPMLSLSPSNNNQQALLEGVLSCNVPQDWATVNKRDFIANVIRQVGPAFQDWKNREMTLNALLNASATLQMLPKVAIKDALGDDYKQACANGQIPEDLKLLDESLGPTRNLAIKIWRWALSVGMVKPILGLLQDGLTPGIVEEIRRWLQGNCPARRSRKR